MNHNKDNKYCKVNWIPPFSEKYCTCRNDYAPQSISEEDKTAIIDSWKFPPVAEEKHLCDDEKNNKGGFCSYSDGLGWRMTCRFCHKKLPDCSGTPPATPMLDEMAKRMNTTNFFSCPTAPSDWENESMSDWTIKDVINHWLGERKTTMDFSLLEEGMQRIEHAAILRTREEVMSWAEKQEWLNKGDLIRFLNQESHE